MHGVEWGKIWRLPQRITYHYLRERFHQMTGWTISPCSEPSQTPKFQCLLLDDGQTPEWLEGDAPISHGGSWTPNTGQAPDWHGGSGSFSWQILEDGDLTKYYLSPGQCSNILKLAQRAGCPPPREIEALLFKQGGEYPSSTPFKTSVCGPWQSAETRKGSLPASENQLTLFLPY